MTIAALLTLQIANRPERLPSIYIKKGETFSWTDNHNNAAYDEIFVEQGGKIQPATPVMKIRCRSLINNGTISVDGLGPAGSLSGSYGGNGGNGGGNIDIYAYTIVNSGLITAKGSNGTANSGGGGGGGSGGFIWIRYVLSYINTGSVLVNGGTGGAHGANRGGGGGGGSFIGSGTAAAAPGGNAGPTYTRAVSRFGSGGGSGGGYNGLSGTQGGGFGGGFGGSNASAVSGTGGTGGLGDALIEQVVMA